jgi:predicted ATPase
VGSGTAGARERRALLGGGGIACPGGSKAHHRRGRCGRGRGGRARGVDVARRQGAKSFELRAAISLARLWVDQGKSAEARDLVTPVSGCFSEGFDTPDLIEAKALLDTLGP